MRTDGHRGDRRRIERAQIRVRSYSLSPGDMQPDPFIPGLAGQAEQGGLPPPAEPTTMVSPGHFGEAGAPTEHTGPNSVGSTEALSVGGQQPG